MHNTVAVVFWVSFGEPVVIRAGEEKDNITCTIILYDVMQSRSTALCGRRQGCGVLTLLFEEVTHIIITHTSINITFDLQISQNRVFVVKIAD